MAPRHTTLAFATLLCTAPWLGAAAAAEPAGSPAPATTTAPAEGTHVHRTNGNELQRVPPVEASAPATPMPMNLPDDATASEVKGEYGIGIAGMILGTVLVAALVIGIFYVISRRSWSASH